MRVLKQSAAFRDGARDMLTVAPGIAAWGLVTGVAMVKTGLPVPVALFMGFIVFAGSAQLSALPLLTAGAPVWLIIATAFCVNLRFVIFSATMRPYLIHLPFVKRLLASYLLADLTMVLFTKRFKTPGITKQEQREQGHYFAGNSVVNYLSWQIPQAAGVLLATSIPSSWGLGFAGILALLGMTLSLVNDKLTSATAAVAALVAVFFVALPLKLNLVLAIVAGMSLALLWQNFIEKKVKVAV
jgi:predicted branched-subunit amino acid permease